jgi:hypothetical protein
MGRKPNNYKGVIKVLEELHTLYPDLNMGRHIATVIEDYGDIWGISDKELLFAFEKYKATLELDAPYTEDKDLEKIIEDAKDFTHILDEEDNEDIY